MKNLLILAALAVGTLSVSAQSSPTTVAPNAATATGKRTGKAINTAPATGPNRASRSSSTTKAAQQGKGTGSGNIETMQKNSSAKPGAKK